ncbi:MAG: hypothetical protein EAZ47_08335 [Bacteroidetes bacterium]|nr:MAG: hypothetical protein EAY72_08940 [Bacteroidota bacterium]TAF92613.1 MAG: hypothetical protein EAZ47_08335 [Bacteroidota bacterium]
MCAANKLVAVQQRQLWEVCENIVQYHHAGITRLCKCIEDYLHTTQQNNGLPLEKLELTSLLFYKLQDELSRVFLKETKILFPCIASKCKTKAKENCSCLHNSVVESLQKNHQNIIQLTQKLRYILHNYSTLNTSTASWHQCLNNFFELENKIMLWIHTEAQELHHATYKPTI